MVDSGETLEDLGPLVWRRWEGALSRKDDPFRTVVLASADPQGAARARMVVVRGVEAASRRIEFHTDARSPKVAQLKADPYATILVWDAVDRLQVRAEGRIALFGHGSALAQARFEALSEEARKSYGTEPAAGTRLERPEALAVSSAEDPARRNFVVAQLTVERLDWLRLTEAGQRRAEIVYESVGATQRWIAP